MLACQRCGSTYLRDVVFCGLDGERLEETDVDPLLGRTIDRYRIEHVLGDGGMARVYRAKHIHLGQDIALKILYGDMASDRTLSERFRREAQSSARIKHPNVVQVMDFGVTEGGLSFMAMELLEGHTLADLIKSEKRLPPSRAADLTRQMALGLAAAHSHGFVHRDLKPKNVMLLDQPGGDLVKILDFGLVRPLEEADARLTARGQVFGTPAYMAPEQITDGEVDIRADLYALGAMLHEMLSGKPPFLGQMTEVFRKHLSMAPPALDDRTGLGELSAVLLSKSPAARPESAAKVIEMIDQLGLTHVSMPAQRAPASSSKPPGTAPQPSAPPKRNGAPNGSTTPPRGAPDPLGVELFDSIELNEAHLRSIASRAGPSWSTPIVVILGLLLLGGGYAWWVLGKETLPAATVEESLQTPANPPAPAEVPTPAPAPRAEVPAPEPAAPAPEPEENLAAAPVAPDASVAAPVPAAPKPGRRDPPRPVIIDGGPTISTDSGPDLIPGSEAVEDPPRDPELPAAAAPPFSELDQGLSWALAQRGLNLRDLSSREPQAVDRWRAWRILAQQEPPDPALLLQAYEALRKAAEQVSIDSGLLRRKIARVRDALEAVAEDRRDGNYLAINGRLATIEEEARRAKAQDFANLAMRLTMLEAEADGLVPGR